MKYLLRERVIQKQSILGRCAQFLSNTFLRPQESTERTSAVLCGLSPDSRVKLHRIQGRLTKKWASAISFRPIQGQSATWTQSSRQVVSVPRPRIRVQIRRIHPEATIKLSNSNPTAVHEVRGLDDIFPERITGFFEEQKPHPNTSSINSVVVDYRIVSSAPPKKEPLKQAVETPKQPVAQFDESWRKKVSWPAPSPKKAKTPAGSDSRLQPARQNTPEALKIQSEKPVCSPAMDELVHPVTRPAALWETMRSKISQILTPIKPVLAALEDENNFQTEVPATDAPTAEAAAAETGYPQTHTETVGQPSPSLLETVTGADLRKMNHSSVLTEDQSGMMPDSGSSEKPSEMETATAQLSTRPQPSLDATLLISKHRKFFSQKQEENLESVMETIAQSKPGPSNQELNYIDYMLRNNQILARSICHLAEQYFQRAALEESTSY
jgi:hypothetical protein